MRRVLFVVPIALAALLIAGAVSPLMGQVEEATETEPAMPETGLVDTASGVVRLSPNLPEWPPDVDDMNEIVHGGSIPNPSLFFPDADQPVCEGEGRCAVHARFQPIFVYGMAGSTLPGAIGLLEQWIGVHDVVVPIDDTDGNRNLVEEVTQKPILDLLCMHETILHHPPTPPTLEIADAGLTAI